MTRLSVRARLTALYAALFAASSAIVLALIYLVMRASLPQVALATFTSDGAEAVVGTTQPGQPAPLDLNQYATTLGASVAADLLQWSIAIMVAMLLVSVALGWIVAGRVLAPVQAMTEQAARISARQLSGRLALAGPHDELWQLGKTLNDMIDRVQAAFDAERRLIANMSHELRTPLATQRAVLEVAFGDDAGDDLPPGADSGSLCHQGADVEALRRAGMAALEQNRRAARVIDAMLALARVEHTGVREPQPVDLAPIVRRCVADARGEAGAAGLTWHLGIAGPSLVQGDRRLLERLVDNLVANAVRYNEPGGQVWIETGNVAGALRLLIANDGAQVAGPDVDRLTMPFKRGQTERTRAVQGEGLGLSIVAAIVRAHGAALDVTARPAGGLRVTVTFPLTAGQ